MFGKTHEPTDIYEDVSAWAMHQLYVVTNEFVFVLLVWSVDAVNSLSSPFLNYLLLPVAIKIYIYFFQCLNCQRCAANVKSIRQQSIANTT